MKLISSFVLLTLIYFVAGSCSSTKDTQKAASQLSQNNWLLFSIRSQEVTIPEGAKIPQLTFDTQNMRVSGNGGCNTISGSFKVNKQNLSFGPIASTRMACPGSDVEPKFLDALSRTAKYSMYNGKLVLNDSSGTQLMVFDPVK